MNRKPTAIAAVAVLGVGALLLAGCAPTNTTKSTPAPQLPTVGWKSVAYSDIQQGGTLNLAALQSGTGGGNWNPNTSLGNEQDVINILAPLSGGPLRATAAGGVELDTDYASEVKLTASSPETIHVVLNPKAVWEDGSPITATDYKATFAALSGKNKAFDLASSAGYNDISSFAVDSPTEFTVKFKSTYADWQNLFQTSPVPAAIASDPVKWGKGFVTAPLPSDGPYVMTGIDNASQSYTETPNPKWWGQAPKLDKITFKVITQAAQGQAFVNGEINAVEAQDVDTYDAALKKADNLKESSGGTSWSLFQFNGKDSLLSDVRVRHALAESVNRTLISKVSNSPLGVAATLDNNYIFMPGQVGYTDAVNAAIPFSPSKAKSDLQAAGWSLNNGKWTKKGKTLALSMIYPNGTKSNELRGEVIQSSFKAIDVHLTLQAVPSDNYFTDITDGKYQIATFGEGGTLFPISSSESLYYPSQKYGNSNGQNFSFITNEKLKSLWDSANSDLNPTHRLKTTAEINKVIASYVPLVPIYPYPNVYIVDKNLANYGPATFELPDWTTVGFTK